MNVIKLILLLMALSTLSHAYQKAFEPTAANTIEIKEKTYTGNLYLFK